MKMPLVSIVVPMYNVAPYLEKCLDSLVSQTYSNTEIILVNDGSTDDTKGIASRYLVEDRNIILVDQKNQGLSAARNAGIKRATGDYLSFVDSDDYVSVDYIEKLHQAIVNDGSDMSSVSFYNVYGKKHVPSRTQSKKIVSGSDVAKEFLTRVLGNDNRAVCGKLFRRTMIIDNRLAFPVGKRHEDLAFLFESFCLSEAISFLGEPLYYYVHRQGSITTSRSVGADYDYDMVEVADKVPGIAGRYSFISKVDVGTFLIEKRLSYIYTRVRKRADVAYFNEVRDWFIANKSLWSNYEHTSFRNRLMISVVILGRVPSKILFTMISILVRIMKLRGSV